MGIKDGIDENLMKWPCSDAHSPNGRGKGTGRGGGVINQNQKWLANLVELCKLGLELPKEKNRLNVHFSSLSLYLTEKGHIQKVEYSKGQKRPNKIGAFLCADLSESEI